MIYTVRTTVLQTFRLTLTTSRVGASQTRQFENHFEHILSLFLLRRKRQASLLSLTPSITSYPGKTLSVRLSSFRPLPPSLFLPPFFSEPSGENFKRTFFLFPNKKGTRQHANLIIPPPPSYKRPLNTICTGTSVGYINITTTMMMKGRRPPRKSPSPSQEKVISIYLRQIDQMSSYGSYIPYPPSPPHSFITRCQVGCLERRRAGR